ncbi:hypothetical protein JZU46_00675, partial [bacterium]|nr:hypothetical protein [bacterium]
MNFQTFNACTMRHVGVTDNCSIIFLAFATHSPMRYDFRSSASNAVFRLIGVLVLALITTLPAHAGSIGFSISFTGDEVAITNTGSEPAYLVSGWTLDAASHWQRVRVESGNAAYLTP